MSKHMVEVVPVVLQPHPNADALSIVRVRGWQAIVRTADWQGRSVGAYVPPDSILPDGLMPDLPRRVRAVRLRGEVSEGLLVPAPEGAAIGDDVAGELGVTHYEPVPEGHSDDAPAPGGYLPVYDVENARRYAGDRWDIGTPLVVTEKIHGENWRATFRDGAVHVGSRTRWKKPGSNFHKGLTPQIEGFLADHEGVILYGECYGGVGGFPYDVPPGGGRRVRVFDVYAGPEEGWWSWETLTAQTEGRGIPLVPLLRGAVPFDGDLGALSAFAEGPTTLGGKHVREGAVVRPLREERPTASAGDRPVLKLVGRGYLTRKDG